jgi:hypothetical protein
VRVAARLGAVGDRGKDAGSWEKAWDSVGRAGSSRGWALAAGHKDGALSRP